MERVHAAPARKGLLIRNPETGRHLPPEGEAVPVTTYWIRRQADGDVVLTDIEPPAPSRSRRNSA